MRDGHPKVPCGDVIAAREVQRASLRGLADLVAVIVDKADAIPD